MFERFAIDRGAMLFDASRIAAPGAELFEPEHWRAAGAVNTEAGGRGSVAFIECGVQHWVIRRYLRGGVAAAIAHDRYLFTGEDRTRSFRELRLLGELCRRRLPVPAPVAACYRTRLVTYTAALITEKLPGARSLSRRLAEAPLDEAQWARIGQTLRRFHDAGVQHADLNAHNIMLGEHGEVWLLDFDRGRLREPGAWREGALDRLARSLRKIRGADTGWRAGFERLRRAHDA
jgi:3-deoxy-D-manno-octulosonic acid kinase